MRGGFLHVPERNSGVEGGGDLVGAAGGGVDAARAAGGKLAYQAAAYSPVGPGYDGDGVSDSS